MKGDKIIPTIGVTGYSGDSDIGLGDYGRCMITNLYKYSVKEAMFYETRYELWLLGDDDNKLQVRITLKTVRIKSME